jgi:hypothetical protein
VWWRVCIGIRRAQAAIPALCELALGGTAVGTGLNTTEGYDVEIAALIAVETVCARVGGGGGCCRALSWPRLAYLASVSAW